MPKPSITTNVATTTTRISRTARMSRTPTRDPPPSPRTALITAVYGRPSSARFGPGGMRTVTGTENAGAVRVATLATMAGGPGPRRGAALGSPEVVRDGVL